MSFDRRDFALTFRWLVLVVAAISLQAASSARAVSLTAHGAPDPTDSSLRLWLDATDLGTLFQDTGGTTPVTAGGQKVALWQDKSGNNLHVSNSDSTWQPTFSSSISALGNQSGVTFSHTGTSGQANVNDMLFRPNDTGIDGNEDRTVITVWRTNAFTGQNFQHTFHMGDQSAIAAYGHSVAKGSTAGSAIGNHYWAGAFDSGADAVGGIGRMALSTWDGDGGTGSNGLDSWYVDGIARGADDRAPLVTGTSQLKIGSRLDGGNQGNEGFDGDLVEVIVYDSVLPEADRLALGRYLEYKYQVVNLPNQYQYESTAVTWSEARQAALDAVAPAGYGRGDLVSINSATENELVADLVSGSTWTGANDMASEGEWVWSDGSGQFWQGDGSGSPVNGRFSAWNQGSSEPNNAGGGEDAGEVTGGGDWNDRSPGSTQGYVIEFPRLSTEATYNNFNNSTQPGYDSGATSYGLFQHKNDDGPEVIADSSAPHYDYVRMLHNQGGQENQLAFDRTAEGVYHTLTGSMDLRFTGNTAADGASLVLANTTPYGTTGALPDLGPWEEPNFDDSFAVGFDIHPNRKEVSLHWDGQVIAEVDSPVDYRNGQFNDVRLRVDYAPGGAWVNMTLGGQALFADQWIPGMVPYEARVAIGARTGGATTTLDIDNVYVDYLGRFGVADSGFEWLGNTGQFSDATKWSGGVVPTGNDDAVINQGLCYASGLSLDGNGSLTIGPYARLDHTGTLWFNQGVAGDYEVFQNGGIVDISDRLYTSGTAGATVTYTMTDGELNVARHIVVGHTGTGVFNQSGGIVTQADDRLILGDVAGSQNNEYNLSGGVLNANELSVADKTNTTAQVTVSGSDTTMNVAGIAFVGTAGAGVVDQSDGQVSIGGDLVLGESTGATGEYNLSGGELNLGGTYLIVGRNGVGTFNQTGGTVNADLTGRVLIADFGGADGSAYNISGGVLNVNGGNELAVGKGGVGEVLQTGGTVNASGDLSLAESGTGTYRLRGGELNVAGSIVDGSGTSEFQYDGGTLDVTGSISVDTLRMGVTGSGTPTLAMTAGESLDVDDDMVVGESAAATVQWNDNTVTIGNRLRLAPNSGGDATITQDGGSVTVGGRLEMTDNAGGTSSYTISGDGELTTNGDYFIVGRRGPGHFRMEDDAVVNVNVSTRLLIADVGSGPAGTTFTVAGGTLNINNGKEMSIGKSATGTFTQTGGTVNASGRIRLGEGSNTGTYELEDGVLNVAHLLKGSPNGGFDFTGGVLNADQVDFLLENNGGTLAPGGIGQAGTTVIDGGYTQDATGTLAIDLGGTGAGLFDLVEVTGDATLDGLLDVDLIDGFVPQLADTFTILTATGTITDNGLDLLWDGPAAMQMNLVDLTGGGQALVLENVPEPGSLVLLALGGLAMLGLGRRRRHR